MHQCLDVEACDLRAVLAIASGDWSEQEMTAWLRERIGGGAIP